MERKIYPSIEALCTAIADRIVELSKNRIAERGKFTIALSGGETPKTLYETLARDYRSKIDWENIHLFWGDERFVAQDDPANNYAMTKRVLIDKIPIPQQNVHPIPIGTYPSDSSNAYSKELRAFFGEEIPSFDLILLGLGGDGHTASLFPGMTVEEMSKGIAIVTDSPLPPPIRISLTLSVINNAKHVAFLVSGSVKRDILNSVVHDSGNLSSKYPAAHVQPKGELVWFVDQAAAEKISLSNDKN